MASIEWSSTDAERYAALARRDRSTDGAFVYGVRTTGVYCRPSCAARLARPENVSFHATCDAAERAGFRACKRCRPKEDSREAVHEAAVRRACALIEAAEQVPALADLAGAVGMSAFHFHRVFKQTTGVTPRAYAVARRAARVRAGLVTAATVTEAIYDAGYNAPSRFYEDASKRLGMTPRAFRGGGPGTTIRFALGQCSLGTVLAAATDRGVCDIALGDDPDALLRELQDRFPNAEFVGGDTEFEGLVARVIALVEKPGQSTGLPLDIRGTAFQQRVWEALRAIPSGNTATYAEIAAAIGAPRAVRAVALACAANRLAVAVPCHRVVRADGGLSGYRWGVARKARLLAREKGAS